VDKTFRNAGQGGHWAWEEGMRINVLRVKLFDKKVNTEYMLSGF